MKNLIKKYSEIIRYLISGGLTFLVSMSSYYLCTIIFDISKPIFLHLSNVISWILAVSFAYWISKKFVFKSKEKSRVEQLKFFMYRILTLLIEIVLMYILVFKIKINDKIAKIIAQIVIIILNYVFSKFFVFKKKRENP